MVQKPNLVRDKSYAFAIEVVHFCALLNEKRHYVISKQLLKSGTSIGANIREGTQAQSKNDFISKMSISLKEAHETSFWLDLIGDTHILSTEQLSSLRASIDELIRILTSIIRTSKAR